MQMHGQLRPGPRHDETGLDGQIESRETRPRVDGRPSPVLGRNGIHLGRWHQQVLRPVIKARITLLTVNHFTV